MIYLLHCDKCHHEWESGNYIGEKCDWCGENSYVLTSYNWNIFKMFKNFMNENKENSKQWQK